MVEMDRGKDDEDKGREEGEGGYEKENMKEQQKRE